MRENADGNEIVLRAEGIRKVYGDLVAVDNLSLEVKKGEIFGLLGHNGAGKSTTIECMLGTKKMNAGKVSLLHMNPHKDRKKLFEKVGVQFQQSYYQDKIKVKEICEVTASLYSKSLDYKALLQEFNILDKQNNFVNELSGGERQKLSILLAILPNPEIIFLDELTTGLDPKARRDMWYYIESLRAKGMTIFLTSHYMDEVEYLCDRICIIKKGKIVIEGTPKSVIHESQTQNLEEAYLLYTEMEVI